MGFAVLPPMPKLGVYILKQTGDLVLIVGTWFYHLEIFYKPRQRRPRMAKPILIDALEYLGEL